MNPYLLRCAPVLILALSCVAPARLSADETPQVPDWALPGSATHQQVPPPKGFHRATVTIPGTIGAFEGQSDVGGALVAGSASYDPSSGSYTILSAGYNIWYSRDEFRYLWKKVSGDVSLAADVRFPNPQGYGDRKAVLVIRQDLNDGSKEVMVALHGAGLIHLALRPEAGADIRETQRLEKSAYATSASIPPRIGIEKRGDAFSLLVSTGGEPMHAVGGPAILHLQAPFYVGIAFCSHQPVTLDSAILSHVLFTEGAP